MTTTTKFTPRPLKRVARCISTATLEFYIPREESGPSEERLALRRLQAVLGDLPPRPAKPLPTAELLTLLRG